jgi:hypothetical protein
MENRYSGTSTAAKATACIVWKGATVTAEIAIAATTTRTLFETLVIFLLITHCPKNLMREHYQSAHRTRDSRRRPWQDHLGSCRTEDGDRIRIQCKHSNRYVRTNEFTGIGALIS